MRRRGSPGRAAPLPGSPSGLAGDPAISVSAPRQPKRPPRPRHCGAGGSRRAARGSRQLFPPACVPPAPVKAWSFPCLGWKKGALPPTPARGWGERGWDRICLCAKGASGEVLLQMNTDELFNL